ncbi:VCBS domain-containing protein [Aeromonas hydrophila]|uniref:VCBS domain-containing protein n=1 Tax=Aeromonas hydrophila TaxID=644 RepID=UPI002377F243|nr:VCBS domain-containing protein [Aeromonas hydrophila]MDD9232068.1 VCBS domain-containing protein [Aeromonas hydrophila]
MRVHWASPSPKAGLDSVDHRRRDQGRGGLVDGTTHTVTITITGVDNSKETNPTTETGT